MIDIRNKNCKLYKTAYDVIIVAGQSNAVGYGRGKYNYLPSKQVKEVYRKEKYNKKQKPKFPLKQYVFKKANLRPKQANGFCLYFADLYQKEMLQEGRDLLILRTAVGGTGFSDSRWGLDDDLYLNTIDMAKQIIEGNANNKIIAVLWHQGESDVLSSASKSYYKDKLKKLIVGLRKDLNIPNLPFIAGEMVEEWYNYQEYGINMYEATIEVISELNNCAFVSSKGLCGNGGNDIIHFSAESNMILGKRYYEQFINLTNKK